MSAHDEMLDNVAAYALGALDGDEARVVAAHLPTCAECQAEYDALRPVVTAVGNAVGNEMVPSPFLKARIMQQVRTQKSPSGSGWRTFAMAAAALLVVFLVYQVSAQISRQQVLKTIAHYSSSSAMPRLTFPFAQGDVIIQGSTMVIAVHGLPALPAGKVYQAWTLARGATKVTPSVTFTPNQHGDATVSIPANGTKIAAAAISVEPAGGSKQPTTKPIAFIKFGK